MNSIELSSEELHSLLNQLKGLSKEQYESLANKLQDIWQTNKEHIQLMTKLLEEEIGKKTEPPKFTAVIPCGGRAGSMYPFSSGMPKTLFVIDTKPMLHHILDSLDKDIFSRIIILNNEFSAAIESSVEHYKSYVECKRVDKDVPAALFEMKNELRDPFLVHYNHSL